MTTPSDPYRGFRYPAEIIQHAVWLYQCFSLSLRGVETILAACGVVVSYETIRGCGLRFDRLFANILKRRRPRPGDKCLTDQVLIRVGGKLHHLWRAVDQEGRVLEILVQSRRNAKAAKRETMPGVEHRQSKYLNNRVEASQQSTERRERQQRFKSPRHVQRFLSAHSRIRNHFPLRHRRLSAHEHRAARDAAFCTWREVVGVAPAA